MADAGLTPMQIIQGTTKWPAEMLGKEDLLGTVEAGKLADVIILSRNPLEDVGNMRAVETVILDGKVIERGYHAGYTDPFLNLGRPSVDGPLQRAPRAQPDREPDGDRGDAGRGRPASGGEVRSRRPESRPDRSVLREWNVGHRDIQRGAPDRQLPALTGVTRIVCQHLSGTASPVRYRPHSVTHTIGVTRARSSVG